MERFKKGHENGLHHVIVVYGQTRQKQENSGTLSKEKEKEKKKKKKKEKRKKKKKEKSQFLFLTFRGQSFLVLGGEVKDKREVTVRVRLAFSYPAVGREASAARNNEA